MQTNLNDVRIFVLAARSGALSVTGKELGVPPSTISRSITRLEQALGLPLLDRDATGLTLTAAGKKYLTTCKRALHSLRDGRRTLERYRADPTGTLRIACPTALTQEFLTPMLVPFASAYAHLQISIDTYASGSIPEDAANFDVLFSLEIPEDSRLKLRSYESNSRGLYASASYFRERHVPVTPSHLQQHACAGDELWCLSKNGVRESPDLAFRLRTADLSTRMQFVSEGAGIGLLPFWMAERLGRYVPLVRVLPEWIVESTTFYVLYQDKAKVTPKVGVFFEAFDSFWAHSDDACVDAQGQNKLYSS